MIGEKLPQATSKSGVLDGWFCKKYQHRAANDAHVSKYLHHLQPIPWEGIGSLRRQAGSHCVCRSSYGRMIWLVRFGKIGERVRNSGQAISNPMSLGLGGVGEALY